MADQEKKKCFVITPIGGENDPIRRHIEGVIDAAIKPALEDSYEIVVAHKMMDPGSITKQVITEIYQDDLVIANLTNRNPNVMYELALRHCLGKPVIMIAEKGTDLPSDVVMERTIFYCNDAMGTLELREKLKSAESTINFDSISSPIHDVIKDIELREKILAIPDTHSSNASDNDQKDALRFILEKLDTIESKLPKARNSSEYPVKRKYVFTFEKMPVHIDEHRMDDLLRDVAVIEQNIFVEDVLMNKNEREIIVVVTLFDRINVPGTYRYFVSALEAQGFKGVKPKPNR